MLTVNQKNHNTTNASITWVGGLPFSRIVGLLHCGFCFVVFYFVKVVCFVDVYIL